MVAGSCTGTPFPIIHGNYKTDYFGDGESYNYDFCAIANPISTGISIYSNGDIFVTNFNTAGVVTRIDESSGKTVWAKAVFVGLTAQHYQFLPYNSLILNDDKAWVVLLSDQGSLLYGGLMQLDSTGNILQIKLFSNSFLGGTIQIKYFSAAKLYLAKNLNTSNSTLVINGGVHYNLSGVGYSEYSYLDSFFMGLSANGSVLWATVVDYNLKYDTFGDLNIYDSTVYAGIFAGFINPSLISLNSSTGRIINFKMFSFFQNSVSDICRFNIIASTLDFVYGQTLLPVRIIEMNDISLIVLISAFDNQTIKIAANINDISYVIEFDLSLRLSNGRNLINMNKIKHQNRVDHKLIHETHSEISLKYKRNTNTSKVIELSNATYLLEPNDIKVYNNSVYYIINGPDQDTYISKSNIETTSSYCEQLFSINSNSNITTFADLVFSENGTDPNEIHLLNSNLSVLYLSNLDLFHDYQILANFIENDITSCLWPNYSPSVYFCTPKLPAFVLLQTYSISVRGNASESSLYIPFEHCQNSRFLIRACANDPTEDGTCVVPNWVIVNQTTASIQIDPKNVSSAGIKQLWLQAQLITGAIKSSIANDFIVTNFVSFNFINKNCELVSSPTDIFVIVNKVNTFDVIFSDEENDNIIMKIVDSAGLGVYIKTINTTYFQVYLNCENESIKSATLVFSSTDIYHTDATYWHNFSVNVNVFLSEPPEYTQLIQNITINKCSKTLVTQVLPSIVDPDSSLFEISFAEQVPSWIYISTLTESGLNNYYINVDCTSENSCQSYSISMPLTVVLSDNSGAWTKYPFSINFESFKDIKFDHIDDINLSMSKPVQIAVGIGNSQFYAEECGTASIVNWICYQSNDNFVFVFDQAKCGFTVDPCNTISMVGTYCVQLFAVDSCGNKESSNRFNVMINPYISLPVTDTFESLTVYQNYYNEVAIPKYLFYDLSLTSNYSYSNCIYDKHNTIATRISTDPTTNVSKLLVIAYGNNGCNITIVDKNSYCQSSEIIVSVKVLNCSSKACFQCKGPTDADCLQCHQGYVLDRSGSCLAYISFAPNTDSMFYTICGIIAMITAIVQIALATRYGKDGFELIMHFQTLLMLSFSSDNISSVRLDYLSWLQAFKFDFGFINPMINQNTQCSISSGRLFNLKLYCEDTLHNYFIIFCFLLILCGAKIIFFILQKYRDRVNFSQKQLVINILWIFVIIVNPFLIINISIDIMTIFNHTISSLFTFAYIMLLAIICFRNKLYFLQYDFIVKLDPQSSPYYIYMQILIKIECILLFLSYSKLVSSLIMITLLMTHTTMLFIQIQHRSVLPLQRNFDRTTTLFCNSVMLIIMMLVSVEKITGSSETQSTKSSVSSEITIDSIFALLITTMCLCCILVSCIRIPCDLIVSCLQRHQKE